MSYPEVKYIVFGINGPQNIPFNILSSFDSRSEVDEFILREGHQFEAVYVFSIAGKSYSFTITKARVTQPQVKLDDLYKCN